MKYRIIRSIGLLIADVSILAGVNNKRKDLDSIDEK